MQSQEKNPWISAYDSDFATHKRNKAGAIVAKKPYRMHCAKLEDGVDVRVFEVPPNSGNLFYEKGGYFKDPAGRLVTEKDAKGRTKQVIKLDEPHVAYTAPLSEDQTLVHDISSIREENAALTKELAALRAEKAQLEEALTAPSAQQGQRR